VNLPLQASYVVPRASSPVQPNTEGRVAFVAIVIVSVAANRFAQVVTKQGVSHPMVFAALRMPLMLIRAPHLELGLEMPQFVR
jgi:hypothetical protein